MNFGEIFRDLDVNFDRFGEKRLKMCRFKDI
jgi:hypothetical protein